MDGNSFPNCKADASFLRRLKGRNRFAVGTSALEIPDNTNLLNQENPRLALKWREATRQIFTRLLDSGHIGICQSVYGAGSAVYRITKDGITLLEHHGQFTAVLHSNTEHLPHLSQVFHSLELNAVQLALARANLLAGWQSEIEIASFNTISRAPYQKDYDAIVDVWIGDHKVRFALEYERILKSLKQYERIRAALEAERQIECVLYLTSGMEVLVHLVHQFQSVRKRLAFAGAATFERHLLDTVVTGRDGITARFWDVLQ